MVLVDSSSWIQAFRAKGGDPVVRARVLHLVTSGDAAWCEIVRLELWNGARGHEERKRLAEFDRELVRLPIDDEVWDAACHVARVARDGGLTVPAHDLVIFACARRHDARIDHCDQHFDKLGKLPLSGN